MNITFTQVLPGDRMTDWSLAGLEHDFHEPGIILNILDYGGAGDSLTDNSSALQSAIEDLNGSAGVIYFPEGIYLFHAGIQMADSVIIRGYSAEDSRLVFDLQQEPVNCFNIGKSQSSDYRQLISGYEKYSQKIEVAGAAGFTEGRYAEIRQQNGAWDTSPVSWAEHSVGQIVKIDSIAGNYLFLKSPLRIDFDEDLNPEIRPLEMISHAGIECLKISRTDEPEQGAGYNIYFAYASNCRIKGVESHKSVGSHVYVTNSSNLEVRGSYFHEAFTYDGTGTRGYGITLNMHTGECLIENNIFRKLRHAMMVKTGANGNVFGYNYSIEPHRSENIHDLTGDISLHGHYAFANLFEGNIVQNIIIDHYWGPSGPLNTFFRNRAELYGFIITASDTTQTHLQNIIGNEITNTQYFHGQYFLNGNDHFEFANNVKAQIIPSGTSDLTDSSYYMQEEPLFWNIEDPWPSLGLPHTLNEYSIPVEQRYFNGANLCLCDDDILTSLAAEQAHNHDLIYPNPSRGVMHFPEQAKINEVYIYDLTGSLLGSYPVQNNSISLPEHFPDGMFIVKTLGKESIRTSKILICR